MLCNDFVAAVIVHEACEHHFVHIATDKTVFKRSEEYNSNYYSYNRQYFSEDIFNGEDRAVLGSVDSYDEDKRYADSQHGGT